MTTIQEQITKKILVLDGAMGTMIQGYGLSEDDFRGQRFVSLRGQLKGNNDVLSITRPDVILDIHNRYLAAGADIIETNTFSSQRISQADYALEDYSREMALAGARLARQAADAFSSSDWPRFVAGSIGPTNKTCSISPDVSNPAARDITYDDMLEAYIEQADALAEGGVDAFLIETIFDTLNAKAAIEACQTVMRRRGIELPVMLSVTVSDLAGRTLSGQTLDAFLASVSSLGIFSVGLNCSFGASQMRPYIEELAAKAPYYISAYPNAGLPNELGQYDETAESMAPQIAALIDSGLVNIIGGCCGTTDEFIRRYAVMARGKQPHTPKPKPTTLWLSGLEMLDVSSDVRFVNVGERCNVAGSRKFLRLISQKCYEEALDIARRQVEDGAMVIDINMDDGLLDAKAEMVTFLNMVASEPEIAKVPIMIDSSKWEVIMAGLKCAQGKCIVNSISLKEGEETFVSHARDIMSHGAAVVVMCFDEEGQATTYDRRIAIARRAYDILTRRVGMNPLDIIFDPNILAIATGMEEHDDYAIDCSLSVATTTSARPCMPYSYIMPQPTAWTSALSTPPLKSLTAISPPTCLSSLRMSFLTAAREHLRNSPRSLPVWLPRRRPPRMPQVESLHSTRTRNGADCRSTTALPMPCARASRHGSPMISKRPLPFIRRPLTSSRGRSWTA